MSTLNAISQERINQMNSSAATFRQLIQSLRTKNRSAFSEANPETERSNPSQTFISEKEVPLKLPITSAISIGSPHIEEDDVIRLKPKGNVAGRDILYKKTTQIHSSKFNSTAESFKLPPKQKQLQEIPQKIVEKNEQVSQVRKNSEQAKLPNKSNQAHHFQHSDEAMMKQSIKNNFNQKKFNAKSSSAKKIKDIDECIVESYCQNSITLSQYSEPSDIFDFFEGLMAETQVGIASPLIKKFKNCIYFGHPILKDEKYEGFLYFYDCKFYYGQFVNSQKHGQGVEILWELKVIFKGIFQEGQKTGKFYVKKNGEQFIGFLDKGLYSGHGKLTTNESIYEGQFFQGQKHGLGEQFYPKTGFKFTGYFHRGAFTKRSKSSFSQNPSHQQLEKGIVFRSKEQRNMNRTHSQFRKPSKQAINYIAPKSSRSHFKNQNALEDSELSVHPFMVQKPIIPDRKRKAYNKQKIKSFLPNFGGAREREAIPENCKDFDYSFDVSSKRDSQMDFNFAKGRRLGLDHGRGIGFEHGRKIGFEHGRGMGFEHGRGIGLEHGHSNGESHFSRIAEEQNNTSAYEEEPLPVPCFYRQN